MSNPRGYPTEETGFDQDFLLELGWASFSDKPQQSDFFPTFWRWDELHLCDLNPNRSRNSHGYVRRDFPAPLRSREGSAWLAGHPR
ncbi:hypothetical protein D3C73_1253780 [compost metagenome]